MTTLQPRQITRKSEVAKIVVELRKILNADGRNAFLEALQRDLLAHKVKFPLAEFAARSLMDDFQPGQYAWLVGEAVQERTIPGYVFSAAILQERLSSELRWCFRQAEAIIIRGDQWYVCDITSERVFGHGLLVEFARALPIISSNGSHASLWMQRSVGVAVHYAVKKGLGRDESNQLFGLLQPLAQRGDYYVKKGVGWGLKTIARYHPDLVQPVLEDILTDPDVNSWNKKKLQMGLSQARRDGNLPAQVSRWPSS